ncbi:MAG: hypothetical protein ACOWYE_12270 [Desulfatiglandales bacterium]
MKPIIESMEMTQQINYKNECHIYLRLKAKGEKVTQSQYCKMRSESIGKTISLGYFKKVLFSLRSIKEPIEKSKHEKGTEKKVRVTQKVPPSTQKKRHHDWDSLKAEFMAGPYNSVSEFCSIRGLKPNTYFRKKTKGWRKNKKKILAATDGKTLEKLIENRATEKMRDLYADTLTIQLKLFDILTTIAHSVSNWKKIDSPSTAREAAKFVLDMLRSFEEILPNIRGLEKMLEINRVFDQLADGKIEFARAAIELTSLGIKLPRVLEIILARYRLQEPPVGDSQIITDEMIMARRQELLEEIHIERDEFAADRKRVAAELKQDMARSE